MTSLSASLGITSPESAGRAPGSWGGGGGGGDRERLKLDKAQFLRCSQGLRRHSGGKKRPEDDAVLVMLCLCSYCCLKKPVWSGLSGKGKRSRFPPKSRSILSKRWLLRGGTVVIYP